MNEQEKYDWMVCVQCLTYNQAHYIEYAMNGFTMQETTFPFVCCIIDDTSTDGEQEVIKEYLDEHFDLEDKNVVRSEETDDYVLTFARHKTNLNCYFAVLFLKYNHYSIKKSKVPYYAQWRDNAKYTAMCEGDDFWIKSDKLQKQFDFMHTHTEFMLCSHNAIVIEDNSWYRSFNSIGESRELTLEDCVNSWIIPTASIFFSNKILRTKFPWSNKRFFTGDQRLITTCAVSGKIYFFNEYMSIYRHYSTSAATQIKNRNGGRIYVCKQLIYLFESINSGTEKKFNDVFERRILELKKEQYSLEHKTILYYLKGLYGKFIMKFFVFWRRYIRPERIDINVDISKYYVK